jgi:hypothetical protein
VKKAIVYYSSVARMEKISTPGFLNIKRINWQ